MRQRRRRQAAWGLAGIPRWKPVYLTEATLTGRPPCRRPL